MAIESQLESRCSATGVLAPPWQRVADELHVGDVVEGRVAYIHPRYVLVEILPGARGLVPLTEVDYVEQTDVASVVSLGEIVPVEILDIDLSEKRATLSIKRGRGRTPRTPLALVPDGRSVGRADTRSEPPTATAAPSDRDRVDTELRSRVKQLERELAESRRQRRAERDSRRTTATRLVADDDITSSERAFLRAVRVAYARTVDEEDRVTFPLRRMKVGRDFLVRLRDLQGIAIEKVVRVCAEAACGRIRHVPARSAHRAGEAGTGGRVRATDGAKLWRASLQNGTAGARRLHWWEAPGDRGGCVEFASVSHHDDFDVSE